MTALDYPVPLVHLKTIPERSGSASRLLCLVAIYSNLSAILIKRKLLKATTRKRKIKANALSLLDFLGQASKSTVHMRILG